MSGTALAADSKPVPLKRTKVVILGDQSVGKTSLLARFVYDTFDPTHQATIRVDVTNKRIFLDDQTVRLQLWDTGGQERFHSLIPSYIRDSSVAIIVYDITNRASFMSANKWVNEVRSERHSDTIIVLVRNKADSSNKRQVTFEEAIQRAGELDIPFMETSAKAGNNIKTLFEIIALSLPSMEKDGTNTDGDNMRLHKSTDLDNDIPPPPEATENQHENLMNNTLRRAGWLRGFRVDGIFEPRISPHPVASYVERAGPFIEENAGDLSTEIYISKNERDANYFQRGWSLGATTTISPWTSSRIAMSNQPNASGTWFTRSIKNKRVKVEVVLEELVPVPELEAAIEEALTRPTTFEKFQAVYRALSHWSIYDDPIALLHT